MSKFWKQLRTEIFLKNQFKILIRIENWSLFKILNLFLIRSLITIWIRTDSTHFFKILNWTLNHNLNKDRFKILNWTENWNLFKEPFQNLEFIFDQVFDHNLDENWFNSVFSKFWTEVTWTNFGNNWELKSF